MGVRFACHVCDKRLNIKRELAGKRGICPACAAKIRIPLADAEKSKPVDDAAQPAWNRPAESPSSAANRPGAGQLSGKAQVPAEPQLTPELHSEPGPPLTPEPQLELETQLPAGELASPQAASSFGEGIPSPTPDVSLRGDDPLPASDGGSADGRVAVEAASNGRAADEVPAEVLAGAAAPSQAEPADLGSLDALTSDAEATWYVRPPSGGQYGPATGEVLQQWIKEGRVASTALLWREGWPRWREATETFPELAGRLPSSESPSVQFGQPSANDSGRAPTTPHQRAQPLSGEADPGAIRRERSTSRTMPIVVLTAVALLLVTLLVLAITW